MDVDGSFSTVGEGSFELPAALNLDKWGTNYQVYLLAEDVNKKLETDYASEPVKLDKPNNMGVTGDCN